MIVEVIDKMDQEEKDYVKSIRNSDLNEKQKENLIEMVKWNNKFKKSIIQELELGL